jgi:tetratricopeptide (TPR) repeat protein
LWAYRINVGEYRKALALAQEFASVATSKGDPADVLIGDRMVGRTFHYLGEHDSARRHLERMLRHYVAPSDRSDLIRYQADQRVMSQCTMANILWLQGFPDQATYMARSAIGNAEAVDHTITLCNALGHAACPVALFNGDLDEAGRYVETLLAHSANRMLAHLRGLCLEGTLLIRRGERESGLQRLSSTLQQHRESGLGGLHFNAFFGELAQGLGEAGRVAEGLVVIDEALERSAINEEAWCAPELLRIKGELVGSAGGAQAVASAEGHLQQGLDLARRQGALSWQLRCATSLARLWREHGHVDRASELLDSIYSEFTEGFETADLRAARTLLALLKNGASGSRS